MVIGATVPTRAAPALSANALMVPGYPPRACQEKFANGSGER